MIASQMIVTIRDKSRLVEAIQAARSSWRTYAPYLDSLYASLRHADVVPPQEVPPDVITMNSRFEITDLRSEEVEAYTLVYPDQEHVGPHTMSVLSPSGVAFLGARLGELIRWFDGEEPRLSKVTEIIYQPESAGDYRA
jgi:regulator of nucleoside diphosphate kinase